MTAPALPAQRRQAVPCETCGRPLPGLLADCDNIPCFAALIDLIVAEDRRAEASDD